MEKLLKQGAKFGVAHIIKLFDPLLSLHFSHNTNENDTFSGVVFAFSSGKLGNISFDDETNVLKSS